MPRAWRIVKAHDAHEAFDGDNGNGGRWNSPETNLVYSSESPSLAILELLVHVEDPARLPALLLIPCEFPETVVQPVEELTTLPDDWASHPPPEVLKEIGDAWARAGKTPVLSVPSAVTEVERNFVINPVHPEFRCVAIGSARKCKLDMRLVKTGS